VPNYHKRTPSDCFFGDFAHWIFPTTMLLTNILFYFQVSYVIFLALLSYVVLNDSKKYTLITWVVLAYALSLTAEELRQVITLL